MRCRSRWLAIVALLFLQWQPSIAGSYKFKLLNFPGPGYQQTVLSGIGRDGGVVGYYFDNIAHHDRGFFWEPGRMTVFPGIFRRIDVPGSLSTKVLAISPSGVAAGTFVAPGATAAMLFSYDIRARKFNTAVSNQTFYQVDSLFINASGVIVGNAIVHQGDVDSEAFQIRTGMLTILPLPSTNDHAPWVVGINSSGLIAGTYIEGPYSRTHSLTWQNGVERPFIFPGASVTGVTSIKDSGVTTGYAGSHGFSTTTTAHEFFSIFLPGFEWTTAVGITRAAAIVGNASKGEGSVLQPFVFYKGVYHMLTLPIARQKFYHVQAINDYGSLVGYGGVGFGSAAPIVAFCTVDQVPCTQ